jgi:hypothetical protein
MIHALPSTLFEILLAIVISFPELEIGIGIFTPANLVDPYINTIHAQLKMV